MNASKSMYVKYCRFALTLSQKALKMKDGGSKVGTSRFVDMPLVGHFHHPHVRGLDSNGETRNKPRPKRLWKR